MARGMGCNVPFKVQAGYKYAVDAQVTNFYQFFYTPYARARGKTALAHRYWEISGRSDGEWLAQRRD